MKRNRSEYMEDYIMTYGTADEIKANLNKYEELVLRNVPGDRKVG